MIFTPWMDSLRAKGCEFLEGRRVTDFFINEETGCVSEVVCGREIYKSDAVVLAVGISTLHDLVKNRCVLIQKLVMSNAHFLSIKVFD